MPQREPSNVETWPLTSVSQCRGLPLTMARTPSWRGFSSPRRPQWLCAAFYCNTHQTACWPLPFWRGAAGWTVSLLLAQSFPLSYQARAVEQSRQIDGHSSHLTPKGHHSTYPNVKFFCLGNGADSREHASLKPFLRKLRVFVISCRNFGNECGLSVFSCVQQKSPCRRSPRPFIHTQEKELIDFEVQCWHLLLFKTRTLATVIHHAFSIATRVRQMKASCCRMRNAK